jgi:hypothetical protein
MHFNVANPQIMDAPFMLPEMYESALSYLQ